MIAGSPPEVFLRTFEPVLARLGDNAERCFGVPAVRLVPVRYEERPFSFLMCVEIWEPHAFERAGRAFLKIFKPKKPSAGIDMRERVVRDFETTRRIHDFMAQWDDAGAIRPIVCYEDLLAIVTEEAPGQTVLHQLEVQAKWFPDSARVRTLEATMRACGRWLRRFHGFDRRDTSVAITDLLAYIDIRLCRLVEQQVIDATYRQRIMRHLDRIAQDVPAAELREVAIHADLAPANMLVHGSRIVVLDFAMATRGSYLHDISRMFLQIDAFRAKPQFRPKTVEMLQSALLHGLDETLTADRPLFRYLLMLHRINHLGTLALRRERFPSSVLSARVQRLHRRWIDNELTRSESQA